MHLSPCACNCFFLHPDAPQVKLPMLGGKKGRSGSDAQTELLAASGDALDESPSASASSNARGSSGNGTSSSAHFSQESSRIVRKDKALSLRVDFDKMEQPQDIDDENEIRRITERYEAQKRKLEDTLARTTPNMKAIQEFEVMRQNLMERKEDVDECIAKARNAAKDFKDVRMKRLSAFMAAFKHVSEVISGVYQDLTRSRTHPRGGTATIALEDEGDPFRAGLIYSVIPANKRYRDMEKLSGGEKTVAALALLFAIHSFRPAPFFVMDEIDAALDNENVAKVSNYIFFSSRRDSKHKQLADRPSPTQCIVISLKDHFYSTADSLVGIYRDTDALSSKTLSLDLSGYGNPPVLSTPARTSSGVRGSFLSLPSQEASFDPDADVLPLRVHSSRHRSSIQSRRISQVPDSPASVRSASVRDDDDDAASVAGSVTDASMSSFSRIRPKRRSRGSILSARTSKSGGGASTAEKERSPAAASRKRTR